MCGNKQTEVMEAYVVYSARVILVQHDSGRDKYANQIVDLLLAYNLKLKQILWQ